MKKIIYFLLTLNFIFFLSCESEQFENKNLESNEITLKINERSSPPNDCNLQYSFYGSANDRSGNRHIDQTGHRSFLFSWDFGLIPCMAGASYEVQIEFKADPSYTCVGYPGVRVDSYIHTTSLTNLFGSQSIYFNPIGDDMIADKVFKYRTIINMKDCSQNGDCIIEGDWQGPLCSYM